MLIPRKGKKIKRRIKSVLYNITGNYFKLIMLLENYLNLHMDYNPKHSLDTVVFESYISYFM